MIKIGEKISEELKNGKIRKILKDLDTNHTENMLLTFDLEYEKPERVEVFLNDTSNYLILWKGLNPPTASIVAESNNEVDELLRKVEDMRCSFIIKPSLSNPIERMYEQKMKRENWIMFSNKKVNFKSFIKQEVEALDAEPIYAEQISKNWLYSDNSDYIMEKMELYPFYGIKKGKELLAHAGIIAETDKDSFLAAAFTKPEWRRKGIQTSLTSKLTEDALQRGKTPCMYIIEGNVPSIKAVSKVGYEPIAVHARFDPI